MSIDIVIRVAFRLGAMTAVGVGAIHHYGWEGIGLIGAMWLLMPTMERQ